MTTEELQAFIPQIWSDVLLGYPAFRRLRNREYKKVIGYNILHGSDTYFSITRGEEGEDEFDFSVSSKYVRLKCDFDPYFHGVMGSGFHCDTLIMENKVYLGGVAILSHQSFLDQLSPTIGEINLLRMTVAGFDDTMDKLKQGLEEALKVSDLFAYGYDVLNKEKTDEEHRVAERYKITA